VLRQVVVLCPCRIAPYWWVAFPPYVFPPERSLSTRGSTLLIISLLCGPAVFCAVPEPGVAWVPDDPRMPPVVDAPWRLPVELKSLSTRGSTLLARFES